MRLSDCFLVLFLVTSAASGDEKDTEKPLDSLREAREYLSEGWRAVEVIPEGASGWIPHDLAGDQTYSLPMKRRRLKKRRKRPQVVVETVETISEETIPIQRPIRPQRVEENMERPLLMETEEQTIKVQQDKVENQKRKTRPLEQEQTQVVDNEDTDQVRNTKPHTEEGDQKRLHVYQQAQPSHYRQQRPQKDDQNHNEPHLVHSKGKKSKPLSQKVEHESEELPAMPRRKQMHQKLEQEQAGDQNHRISTPPEKEVHVSENKDERGTVKLQSKERHQENGEAPQIQRRKIRPQRLDQVDESWEEMKDEMNGRPNIRRRPPPNYQSSSEEDTSGFNSAEEGHNHGQRQASRLSNEDKDSALADLKSLLKKSQGSISLSEILQQKNLSLTEVLNGNQKAISALTEKPLEATEPMPTKVLEVEQSTKYKRLPPSIALRKNSNKIEDNGEALSTRELQEAQKRRTAILQNHKEKIFSTVTKMDVVTEALTERRIFVPSHPKLYTSLNYKPDFATYFELSTEPITNEIQTTTPTSTTSAPKDITTGRMHLKPKSKIPKVKITIKPQRNTEVNLMTSAFPKPIKIDISEVLGFKEETEKLKDEPMRMPINLDTFMDRTTNRIYESTQKPRITVTTSKYSEEPVSLEKLPHITAKDEISEILKDQKDRERLAKILESRNMTLEELVEQRERGSSQLHLADIFHNKTKEPKPIGEPHIGRIMSNFVQSLPVFSTPKELESSHDRALPQLGSVIPEIGPDVPTNNKPQGAMFLGQIVVPETEDAMHREMHRGKVLPDVIPAFTRKQKSYGVELSPEPPTSTRSILEEPNETKVGDSQSSVGSSATVVETDKHPTQKDVSQDFPVGKLDIEHVNSLSWQKVYPELFPELYEGFKDNKDDTFITSPPVSLDETLQRLEETDDSSAMSSKERFSVNRFDNQRFINVPSGVKSVLIVSFSIIGLSILVFLTILMVFRWLQKQRRKMNYCGSLSSKLRSPMLMQGSPTAAIKTFMNETLGRRKHYYKSNVHCMTDETWEGDRERTPSF